MEPNPNFNLEQTTTAPILSSSISSLLVASSLIGPMDTTSNTTSSTNITTSSSSEANSSNVQMTTTTITAATTSSASNSKNMKHFKKSMIVEYERIESNGGIDESSHSSTASSSSSNSNSSSSSSNGVGDSCQAAATSFANTVISKSSSSHHHQHHHHHHHHSTESKKSEAESSKKRKRKSIDETDKNATMEGGEKGANSNVSLSTVVAAAAQFNSDLYEDESGDSMEHDYSKTSHSKAFDRNKISNEISGGELSDGNTRSDFDMTDTKRKKIHDTENIQSSNKKAAKINEAEIKKDPSKHSKNKHSSSSSKIDSFKKSGDKPVDKPSNFIETKEPKADKKNLEVYCICKSSDSTRFMIACDKCDEWYHGDCVGVTQSLSKRIKTFFCHLCRQKKSSLKIKYKSQFQEMSKNLTKENVRQQENSANGENLVKFFKETQARKKKEAELLKGLTTSSSSSTTTATTTTTNPSEKKISKSLNPNNKISNTQITTKNEINTETSSTMTSSTSIVSSSKTLSDDNNNNKTAFDSPTISSLSLSSSKLYGKTNVSGEDIANFFSAITKLNSTDAHLASTTSANATSNNQVSSTTNEVSSSSSSPSKTSALSFIKKNKTDSDSHDESGTIKKQKTSNTAMFNSENSNSAADDEHESDSNDTSSINTDAKETNDSSDENRTNNNTNNNDEEEDENDSSDSDFSGFENRQSLKARRKSEDSQRSVSNLEKSGKNFKNKQLKTQNKKSSNVKKLSTSSNAIKTKQPKAKVPKATKQPIQKKRTNRNSSSTNHNDLDELDQARNDKLNLERKEPQQCQGPECVREAYEKSKYCSYECGMRLAKDRLVNFLKLRFDQYNQEEPLSTKLNQTELERCNHEIDQLKSHLSNLEKKHEDLDKVIDRAKFEKINPNVEKEREKLIDTNETEIYCITCGQVCSERHALKHMEKCFNKLESQAFFGSFYKTHIEGKSMFCDFYNSQTKMYCKRLKVMCPEHEKEKKVNDDEVCGCPLPKLIEYDDHTLDSANIELCLAPKRTCSVHFKWEKIRRAQIDLEKLRAWLKMEELLEQKKLHETSLAQRGGLLSVLLHQTTSNSQINTENSTVEVSSTMDVDSMHKNDIQVSAVS